MMKKKKEDGVLVWEDKQGKYKLGYSQYLELQRLKYDKLILVALVVLIVLAIAAGLYAFTLIQRIDLLDPLKNLATGLLALF